ncbi:MAG: primosomal protein N' [Planctomycetes bacterium]|nr:primosomal protein N' [Planctomycetota bacterium]
MKYVEIVFPIPLDRRFHYRIPESLSGQIDIGMLVGVNFNNRSAIGYGVGLTDTLPVGISEKWVKDIEKIIDNSVMLSPAMVKLCEWISQYYFCSLGQALEAALPVGVRRERVAKARVSPKKRQSFLFSEGTVDKTEPFNPTPAQALALDTIIPTLEANKNEVFVIHGVTGSGKTEIYLQAIARVRELGKQSIVLVPEIALTPQTINRFRQRFPDKDIAVLHSYLTEKERREEWHRIRRSEASIIIGARSAVFAPCPNLGLIVIDEEHEPTYKQQNTPFYHARDTAIKRAQLENASVILGSATPSLESFHKASSGAYKLITLPERVAKRPMPVVEIIDMTQEANSKGAVPVLSRKLEALIKSEVSRDNQVILFLNRRGFVTAVRCQRCKFIMRCTRCQVALTFHKEINKAVCHYCSRTYDLPRTCPECGYHKLSLSGLGTEKVEEHIKKLFDTLTAEAQRTQSGRSVHKVSRMDSDVMKSAGMYKEALHNLAIGEIDVLVGTQMIAKGLDFPNVTLVGIISGDTILYLKDYHSAERTFQLIIHVAGRSGRGPKGGRVIVQTVNPDHYSIQAAARHDYEGFARKELLYRYELNYPPFSDLLLILVQGRKEDDVARMAGAIADEIMPLVDKGKIDEVLGPAPAPLARLRNRYRWQVHRNPISML